MGSFDSADVPYLLGLVGYGLMVAGVAMLSTPAALITAGGMLLAWAGWRVWRKRGQG